MCINLCMYVCMYMIYLIGCFEKDSSHLDERFVGDEEGS